LYKFFERTNLSSILYKTCELLALVLYTNLNFSDTEVVLTARLEVNGKLGNGKVGNGKVGNGKLSKENWATGKFGNGKFGNNFLVGSVKSATVKLAMVNWATVIRVTKNWALRIALVRCC